ncbi:hypothetical protein CIG75_01760 [Tumebacillus algifaecis]|uniref:Peptidase M1 membrane alanine aminopeptidase domain-containing protein n=1 Tax=Tumebacillus algifaecis TaxID=1214604 RepID=A0A223CWZ8_9BACL|nr:M1 family aminopeptidase [Tumebacillus algifaecis]ASS73822.1 hypothetical protein CIG75_01760 [Tumebacillus algifaecis]
MRRRKRFLKLYSVMLTLLATLAVLAVVLRPADGWTPILKQQYMLYFGAQVLHLHPLAAPTPTEPSYQIKARFDERTGKITGEMSVTVPELRLDGLPLYLYVPMQVQDVKVNDAAVDVSATAQEVIVPAKKSTFPQTVTLSFVTQLPAAPSRTGWWRDVATASYWYPLVGVERDGEWMKRPQSLGFGDPYLMDLGNYEVEWQSGAALKWYTSGQLVSEQSLEDGQKLLRYRAQKVRNFALVGGAGFQETTYRTEKGLSVTVASVAAANLPRTLALTRSAVETYSEKVGTNPFPVLSVLELPPGTIYAHELPNLALFSEDLWGYDDPEHWIVHEIAHAWFYHAVGNYEVETPWLDEGLADYAALLDAERRDGAAAYQAKIDDAWKRFANQYTYSPYKYGTPNRVKTGKSAVPYGTYQTSQAHYYYSYQRPVLMYHDLRQRLGDEQFFKFLQQYYLKNVGRTATRSDLEQALTDIDPQAIAVLNLWLDTANDELIELVQDRF